MRYKILSILLLLLIASSNVEVSAHDWYPFACCSNNDCHPVPCEGILEKGKGLVYHGFYFYDSMIKPSLDGLCHVCISNEQGTGGYSPVPHCIFIQQGS